MVSVRMDEEDLAFVKAHTDNVSEFVRAALHEEIRRRRVLDAVARLAKVAATAPAARQSAVEIIREGRAELDAKWDRPRGGKPKPEGR